MLLHVLDDRDRQANGITLALIAQTMRNTPGPHLLLLLGGSAIEHSARDAGIEPVARVGAPLGRPLLAPTAVHHAMHPRLADGTEPDEVHAWSVSALAAAAVFRPHTPRVFHGTLPPDPATARRLYKLMMRAGYDADVLNEHQRALLLEAGLPKGRVFVDDTRLEAAALLERNAKATNTDENNGETFTVLLLAEPAWSAPTYPAALALSITDEVTDQAKRLIVHPNQVGRPEMRAMLEPSGRTALMAQDERTDRPWELLSGVDAVLMTEQAGPLSAGVALRSGRPIVAPDVPVLRGLLGDAPENDPADITWATDARPRSLAHALTQLIQRKPALASSR